MSDQNKSRSFTVSLYRTIDIMFARLMLPNAFHELWDNGYPGLNPMKKNS